VPTLDAQLRDAAPRLLRREWTHEAQKLAEEVYSILANLRADSTGPVQINNRDTVFVAAPLESLDLPFLDFDAATAEEALSNLQVREPSATQIDVFRYFTRRVMLTAQIVSRQASGLYTLNIFPNGFDGSLPTQYAGVREVQDRALPNGTRVLVNRLDVIEAAEVRLDDGQIQGTRLSLVRREHFFSAWTGAIAAGVLVAHIAPAPVSGGYDWTTGYVDVEVGSIP
jgi:hypothetical protein